MTPERKAQLFAELDAEFGIAPSPTPEPPRPKLVAEEGRVVAPAEVRVSPADPNWRYGTNGFVRIDMEAYERQRLQREADAEREAARRRELDPCNLEIWGR